MGGWEVLEHTADTGIRATGDGPEEALVNAALGMFSILTDLDTVRPVREARVKVAATDREALLHDWLEELLFLSQTRGMLFSRFAVQHFADTHLDAIAWGEPLDAERHPLKVEIKAVTYHQLRFGPAGDGWEAAAVFDI